jgi:hypothetical protein
MDEATVREAAETHARATVERDYGTAGSYLTKEMMASAGEVMKQMPGRLTGAEVLTAEPAGEGFSARIRYTSDEGSVTIESRWQEVDGQPKIVGLDVVERS